MLVLTRKLQQQIKIGQEITVTILRVKGHTVRVGIEAPREVRVVRGELPREVAAADADEGIEETTLVITGETEECESADDSGAPREVPADAQLSAVGPPTSPRLPQRKQFTRANHPPLRVTMASVSPTLAK